MTELIIKNKFHENKDWNMALLSISIFNIRHQEQVPRKQGLKPLCQNIINCARYPSRTSSTKTRIETQSFGGPSIPYPYIKNKFHENKDWNINPGFREITQTAIKNKFHENKDWNIWTSGWTQTRLSIKNKFHENKDWNFGQPARDVLVFVIKNKFHENKDWNQIVIYRSSIFLNIKNKFHENKDWNTYFPWESVG